MVNVIKKLILISLFSMKNLIVKEILKEIRYIEIETGIESKYLIKSFSIRVAFEFFVIERYKPKGAAS